MNLFKNTKDTAKDEEAEKQIIAKSKIDNLIKNQINFIDNMKCPICGNTEFNEGYISNNRPPGGRMYHIFTYHNGHNEEHKSKIIVCSTCGHVQIFADFQTKQIKQIR